MKYNTHRGKGTKHINVQYTESLESEHPFNYHLNKEIEPCLHWRSTLLDHISFILLDRYDDFSFDILCISIILVCSHK